MKNIVPTHSFFTALVILSFSLVGFWSANAQTGKKAATLKGKITDAQTNAPLGYATIRVLKSTDSTLVSGAISDDKGLFSVDAAYGQYYAVIEFIGYKSLKTSPYTLSKEQSSHDLGILVQNLG